DSMSPAQKKVIDNHCTTEWAEKVAGPWADFEANGRVKMRADKAHEVYKLDAAQLDAWNKVVAPLEKEWADSVKKVGGDPVAIKASLDAEIKKYGAGL
ncbi:MAG: C4-dicarboxylate ABC transporter, partial [Hyphomicrobiales bacterium]|nr:C4-dicarboxylate ABC transporter [Hyphomicrobiales bacterium]